MVSCRKNSEEMATFARVGSSPFRCCASAKNKGWILSATKICHVLFLVLGYVSIEQVFALNDGKPAGGYYPFPPPPPPPYPVIPPTGGKSWKGGSRYPTIYPSYPQIYPGGGGSYFPPSKPSTGSIFPPYPTGGKSWGGGGGGGGNIIHVPIPYPVMVPTGPGFGGGGGGGGHKKGLFSGLKSKLKGKFSGLKGIVGGGGIPMIYMPIGHGFGGGSSIDIGGKFGGKFGKFNKGGDKFGGKYPFGSFGDSFGDLGIPQSGKSIGGTSGGGGGGGGWYPGGGTGTLYPTNIQGPSCYDSSQCGMRSCCAMTPYGPKCQPLTSQTLSRCIDAMPQRPQILPPGPPSFQILPPQPRPIPSVQVLPPRPQTYPTTIEVLPPGPTIHILPERPPNVGTGGGVGGKSWRPPPIGQPDSNCRPGSCPRYSTNEGTTGIFCNEDGDCPYPRKCCAQIGSKSNDRRRTCVFPTYSR